MSGPLENRVCVWPAWIVAGLVCLMVTGLSGCRSTSTPGAGAGPAPLASVNISGNTPGQIRAVAQEVFEQQGYQGVRTSPNELVLEKPGTRWSNLAYGNWVDSPTAYRVKLKLTVAGLTDCRLDCWAYVVRDKGTATEEELPLYKSGPYKKLLQEVAARFGKPKDQGSS